MIIYNYDYNGVLLGQGMADESPLEPGVWLIPALATTIEPPAEDLENIRVFNEATQEWGYTRKGSGTVVTPTPQGPTNQDISDERDRRLALGKSVVLDSLRVPLVQLRPVDQVNLMSIKGSTIEVPFRDGFNKIFKLTPEEATYLANEGLSFASYINQQAWKLKDLEERPNDYKSDKYW